MIGDNIETAGLDVIPTPTDDEYRTASQQIALNGRSPEEVRMFLSQLGFLPYEGILLPRGGRPVSVVRECNGYLRARGQARRGAA